MQKLYLFNPDHDMALANSDVNYMPPATVRQLASDLAVLPAWYADAGSAVLAPSAFNRAFLDEQRTVFPQLAHLVTEAEAGDEDFMPVPWGWDWAVYKRLLIAGIRPEVLPPASQLDDVRRCSNRKQAVEMLRKTAKGKDFCGESYYFTEKEAIHNFVINNEMCVLKAPLSGSGKGLNWCKRKFTYHIEHWCENILNKQGGVVAEPYYRKAADFAMQFHADERGQVRFAGYSLFETNISGAYMGNRLSTDEELEKELTKYISLSCIEQTKQTLIDELTGVFAGVYTGYLGVDMMICLFDDAPHYRMHPCVEINLRMTMGMTARMFYDRYVVPGAQGIFRVDYFPSTETLKEECRRMQQDYPVEYSGSRLLRGYLPLVPVTPGSRYHAWVIVD